MVWPLSLNVPELPQRLRDLMRHRPGARVLVGVTGPPGVGKSTIAQELSTELGSAAQLLPMDGFHLAQAELTRLGRDERKGAPDTFDVTGFVNTLQRIYADQGTVLAPAFNRSLEEPIAASIAIEPQHRCVIVEGNYLLHDALGWENVEQLLDECWFLELPDDVRRARLVKRHVAFGRSDSAARDWVNRVDEANAELIARSRSRAGVLVTARDSGCSL